MGYIKKFNDIFLNENHSKFPVSSDGRMGLNLEFKYKNRVYYINTIDRVVSTDQYGDTVVKIPDNIVLPNMNTIEDTIPGEDFYDRINKLEQSLEVTNPKYKTLQNFLTSIDWYEEFEKSDFKVSLQNFVNEYGKDTVIKILTEIDEK